jgi:hypothetical protein
MLLEESPATKHPKVFLKPENNYYDSKMKQKAVFSFIDLQARNSKRKYKTRRNTHLRDKLQVRLNSKRALQAYDSPIPRYHSLKLTIHITLKTITKHNLYFT